MDRKNEIRQELEEIAPLLADIKKDKNGFRVPEHYFTQLQDDVLQRVNLVHGEAASAPSFLQKMLRDSVLTIHWLLQPRYVLRLAGFGLVLALGIYVFFPKSATSEKEYLANITQVEVTEYVHQHIDEFELEDMLEVSEIDASSLLPVAGSPDDFPEEYINDIIDDFNLDELQEIL